jgi:hypothetical protein
MAGLAAEINAEPTENGGIKRRKIWQIVAALDEEDRAAFVAALNDYTVPGTAIRRALAKRGISLSESVISKYRNGLYGTL